MDSTSRRRLVARAKLTPDEVAVLKRYAERRGLHLQAVLDEAFRVGLEYAIEDAESDELPPPPPSVSIAPLLAPNRSSIPLS